MCPSSAEKAYPPKVGLFCKRRPDDCCWDYWLIYSLCPSSESEDSLLPLIFGAGAESLPVPVDPPSSFWYSPELAAEFNSISCCVSPSLG